MQSNQKPNPSDHAGEITKKEKSGPEQPAAQAAPSCLPMHQPKAATQQTNQNDKHWLDYAIGIFAFVAAIGGGFAAAFSGWQAWIAGDSEVRQLRAYMGVSVADIECCDPSAKRPEAVGPGEILKDVIVYEMKNYGNTPAKRITGHFNLFKTQFPFLLPTDFNFKDLQPAIKSQVEVEYVASPQQSIPFRIPLADQSYITMARDKKIFLWLYGHIDYFDAFNIERHTLYCFLYLPWESGTHRFPPCQKHNDQT